MSPKPCTCSLKPTFNFSLTAASRRNLIYPFNVFQAIFESSCWLYLPEPQASRHDRVHPTLLRTRPQGSSAVSGHQVLEPQVQVERQLRRVCCRKGDHRVQLRSRHAGHLLPSEGGNPADCQGAAGMSPQFTFQVILGSTQSSLICRKQAHLSLVYIHDLIMTASQYPTMDKSQEFVRVD